MTAPPAALDRINIDVTETLATGKWTGIERVVRHFAAELQVIADPPRIRLVVAIGGRFHALNEAGRAQLTHPTLGGAGGGGGRLTRMVGDLLSRVPRLLLRVQAWQKERQFRAVLRRCSDTRPAEFGPGDVVLLLDSYWAGTSAVAAAGRARRLGAAVVSTIYDLIPITHPQFMPRSLTSAFPRRIDAALRVSDGAIAISRFSAAELRRWLGHRLPDLPIAPFRLGNDPTGRPAEPDRPFASRYTVVGTIEPRKRHDFILDAFEQRWAAGERCALTIVGRIGWAAPATRARLADLQATGRIRLIHDADDARLAAILADTDAVIMASEVEGFGLPIVEALAFGIPVIASDIAIFREVGGNAIVPFDPASSGALVAAMRQLEEDPAAWRARARAYRWPSWREAAGQLLVVLRTVLDASVARSGLD